MSSFTFPAFPGVEVEVQRELSYVNTTHTSVSRKEQRTNWATISRRKFVLKIGALRSNVNMTTGIGTYSEINTLIGFFDVHLGTWDSFLYVDPYSGATTRVRFSEDKLNMVQVVPGLWEANVILLEVV